MSNIISYESFCKAFKDVDNNKNKELAYMSLYLQNWIIALDELVNKETNKDNLDQLIINKNNKKIEQEKYDVLSKIVNDTVNAFSHISSNMRENIIRENVVMPIHKVKEINSKGIIWLSRKPGKNVREKIASSNSMMAVERRMTLDTGENKLFIAFLRELSNLLEIKLDNLPENVVPKIEEEYLSRIFSFIRTSEIEEIGNWENMPPNNSLLSDNYYKKIWSGWNELKNIDDYIANKNKSYNGKLCEIFYIEFIIKASKYFRFPQLPIDVNYNDYNINIVSNMFYAIDSNNEILNLSKSNNIIKLTYKKIILKILFDNQDAKFIVNDEQVNALYLNSGNIGKLVEFALVKLGTKDLNKLDSLVAHTVEKFDTLVIDFFKPKPLYIGDDGDLKKLQGRIIQQKQKWNYNNSDKTYYLSSDKSTSIIMSDNIETYSLKSIVNNYSNKKLNALSSLMHLLENYIIADNLIFVFPDVYDEFKLSSVHKTARMAYRIVRAFPKSIGVAFDIQEKLIEDGFKENDFLLVIDYIDDEITFTLLKAMITDDLESSKVDYNGFVWERYPTETKEFYEISKIIKNTLLKYGCNKFELEKILDVFDLIESEENLSIFFDESSNFTFTKEFYNDLKNIKSDVSLLVAEFRKNYEKIIGKSRIEVVSVNKNFNYRGNLGYQYSSTECSLKGYNKYKKYQNEFEFTLWRDHLPDLSIKLLYSKFDLIKGETVTPEFNKEKVIYIENTFTLPKGVVEHKFHLIQNDKSKKSKFVAIVRNKVFPLKENVECKLHMTYKYGDENPYNLVFKPIDTKKAGFVEANVIWEPLVSYPYKDLIFPKANEKLPWSEMYGMLKRDGSIFDAPTELIHIFDDIKKDYFLYEFNVNSVNTRISKNNFKYFQSDCIVYDEPSIIKFSEANIETKEKANGLSFDKNVIISYNLELINNNVERHYIDLIEEFGSNFEWRHKGDYRYYCHPNYEIDGVYKSIAFYKSNFVNEVDFDLSVTNLSFEIRKEKDKLIAVNIYNENLGEVYIAKKEYIAKSIRKGNKPPFYVYKGWVNFLLLTMFLGENSMYDEECPNDLREKFLETKDRFIDLYEFCDSKLVKSKLLGFLSVLSKDIGKDYYRVANEALDMYLNTEVRDRKLTDYIGYGLGSCSSEYEKQLLDRICILPDDKIVCILSKAIWGHKDFVYNIPIEILIKYFNIAIDWIPRIIKEGSKNYKKSSDIVMCLEYILGVFRRRELNEVEVQFQLSLNNPKVEELNTILEMLVNMEIKIKTYLNVAVTNKQLEKIPDLLYALLVYIKGEKNDSEIIIKGINEESSDND